MIGIIDISEHNGIINFSKLKDSGIEGAIIRCGYGKGNKDKMFDEYIKAAIKAELKYIGIYYFSYAYTLIIARREAQYCNDMIAPYRKHINLPVFFDWEYASRDYARKNGYNLSRPAITEMHEVFCDRIKDLGWIPGYYTNLDYQNNYIDTSKLKAYKKWFAYYNNSLKGNTCDYWQHSSTGKIKGIGTNVDLDYILDNSNIPKQVKPSKPASKPSDNDEDYDMKTIKRGSTGKIVRIWQIIIGTTSDGIFGKNTEEKTKAFQKRHGLTQDGVVGSKTWKKGLESL